VEHEISFSNSSFFFEFIQSKTFDFRRRFAEHVIVTAAKIVGNNSDGDFVGGYEWCIEQVRNSTYLELASGLEIQKAIAYLREDNFPKVR